MEELKKVLLIGAHVGTIVGDISADGKIDLKDIPAVFRVIIEARKLTEVDYQKAVDQWTNASKEDLTKLTEEFSKEFDLPVDGAEKKVEEIVGFTLGLVSDLLKLIASCKDIKKVM